MEPTRIYFYLLLFIYYVFLIPSINTIFILESIFFLGTWSTRNYYVRDSSSTDAENAPWNGSGSIEAFREVTK